MTPARVPLPPGDATRSQRPWHAPFSVRRADRLARFVVTLSGTAVLAAVLGILLFLLWVVVPLFVPASARARPTGQLVPAFVSAGLVEARVDDMAVLAAILAGDGSLVGIHLPTGATLPRAPDGLRLPAPITAFAAAPSSPAIALGLGNGAIALGTFDFDVTFPRTQELGGAPPSLVAGESAPWGDGVLAKTPHGEWRRTRPRLSIQAILDPSPREAGPSAAAALAPSPASPSSIRSLALRFADGKGVVLALRDAAPPVLARLRAIEDFVTGERRLELERVPLDVVPSGPRYAHGLVDERGNVVLLVESNGRTTRIDVTEPNRPRVVRDDDAILTTPGGAVTDARFALGDQTVLVGDDEGEVSAWFLLRADEDDGDGDGRRLVRARGFEPHAFAVDRIVPSRRSKLFATVSRDGEIWLRHGTTGKTTLELQPRLPSAPVLVSLSPKEDALVAVGRSGVVWSWTIDAPHPDVSFGVLFGEVWYEGHPGPSLAWQSSGGTDDYEPKWSLVPLLAGTLKGTLYALLLAVPIGILAAIFTAEFLHPRARAGVKPAVELMASIPSVVLGFLAALVLAPFVEASLAPLLVVLAAVPGALAIGGFLYQLFPARNERMRRWTRMILVVGTIAAGAWIGMRVTGGVERFFFDGDLRLWLEGRAGRPTPLNAALLLPITALLTFLVERRFPIPVLRPAAGASSVPSGLLEIGRGILLVDLALATAWLGGLSMTHLGLDPRELFCGPYVQRNTLVVAFAMGFAVVPILFTIAEDALRAVPASLRSASLACGASPWQTTVRVVLPLALPGIFSAIMIAFGRAVGETMIVLMAAGNTPLLGGNLFEGFRALSANLAVELPEASVGGSLYRVLFLSAVLLFGMTLLVNTAAEVVRQRSRRRRESL